MKQDRVHSSGSDGARAVRTVAGLFIAYCAAFLAGLVSIYKPDQLPGEPLFQPVAMQPLFYVCAVVVAVVWLFARNWSRKTVNIVFASGLGLLLLSVFALVYASTRQGPSQLSVPMFLAQNLGMLAIPFVSVVSVVAEKNKKEAAGA